MIIIKRKTYDLNIDISIPKIETKLKTYLLIDKQDNILAGSSIADNFDEWECIVINNEPLLTMALRQFEIDIVLENNMDRVIDIINEINNYIAEYKKNIDQCILGLDLIEKRCIENVYFDKPPQYSFDKHKKKKKEDQEQEEVYDLFNIMEAY